MQKFSQNFFGSLLLRTGFDSAIGWKRMVWFIPLECKEFAIDIQDDLWAIYEL